MTGSGMAPLLAPKQERGFEKPILRGLSLKEKQIEGHPTVVKAIPKSADPCKKEPEGLQRSLVYPARIGPASILSSCGGPHPSAFRSSRSADIIAKLIKSASIKDWSPPP